MVVLTIYTDRFDSRENVCGNGMSGKVFLDIIDGKDDESGQEFNSLDEALEYAWEKNVEIEDEGNQSLFSLISLNQANNSFLIIHRLSGKQWHKYASDHRALYG